MNAVKTSLWALFTLIVTNRNLVVCKTDRKDCEICYLNDAKCLSSGAAKVYASVVTGSNGLVKPMDPLCIHKIKSTKGETNFILSGITLIGLKSCGVTELQADVNETMYYHHVYCPRLTSTFDLEITDESKSIYVIAKNLYIKACDYEILNKGEYRIYIDENDFLPHVYVKSVTSNVDHQGQVIFEIGRAKNADDLKNLIEVNGETVNDVSKYLMSLIVKKAMRILMLDRIQTYCQKFLMSEIYPKNYTKIPAYAKPNQMINHC